MSNTGTNDHPPALPTDTTMTSTASNEHTFRTSPARAPKRKLFDSTSANSTFPENHGGTDKRRKGTAPIKAEYLVDASTNENGEVQPSVQAAADDDAAEEFHHQDRRQQQGNVGHNAKKSKARDRNQGQNKGRKFGTSRDEVGLCSTRTLAPEFSPKPCPFSEKCKFEHDLRRYLKEHKREDLTTFNGLCPVWELKGRCPVGWKCRFVNSHSKELEHEDGRKELVLVEDHERMAKFQDDNDEESEIGVANAIKFGDRMALAKKKFQLPKADKYIKWLDESLQDPEEQGRRQKRERRQQQDAGGLRNSSSPEPMDQDQQESSKTTKADHRSAYADSPLLPSEKRRIYFGAETPVLAPLTTQGNLPFRRLCTSLGATFTYSEMAMSLPLIQGQKGEWALIKAHESEVQPPTFTMRLSTNLSSPNIVHDYDQSRDMRFGAQIAANKPWVAIRATEALTSLLPGTLRCIDLNVGCPIDLVYREGAGSALMDSPNKLDKILRGMNAVSGTTPITVKIRTGTKDKFPTAQKLVERLILGPEHSRGDPCGVAAITLHGRSRQQRYTKSADWEYIADTAALIKNLNEQAAALADTIHEVDERDLPNGAHASRNKKVFFLGNGDVYSHVHYNTHITESGVDSAMLGRGALIKPWLFEEIESNQYLDKRSSERLEYIEKFCRFGLEAWGADEVGVGQTRRFLLEWLSFACRYVPIGLLEVLPPQINERPPRYHGRDEMETLMASDNYKDWIKISEMFLGPAHKDFRFEPKHKSNSYEMEAEG